jgi:hypothetical protein
MTGKIVWMEDLPYVVNVLHLCRRYYAKREKNQPPHDVVLV